MTQVFIGSKANVAFQQQLLPSLRTCNLGKDVLVLEKGAGLVRLQGEDRQKEGLSRTFRLEAL